MLTASVARVAAHPHTAVPVIGRLSGPEDQALVERLHHMIRAGDFVSEQDNHVEASIIKLLVFLGARHLHEALMDDGYRRVAADPEVQ